MTTLSEAAPEQLRSALSANSSTLPDSPNSVTPDQAYRLQSEGAIVIDVRTIEERKVEGYIPGSIHIAWEVGPALIKNPRFIRELQIKVPKDATALFVCRAARRSAFAAEAAAKAGFTQAYNVLEGADGNETGGPGWRARGLPWLND